MKSLIIATKNQGKMKDFKKLFEPYQVEVKSLLDLDQPIGEIEETGTTFEENAAIKAETICDKFQIPVIADDSGIEVDALDGAPGVYSARYAGEQKDDQANLVKVLHELKEVPEKERTARFVCVLAIAQPNKETIYKRGECEGYIGFEAKGSYGFGYDPIFYPEGYDKTMAELSPIQKNQISHRKKALDQIENWVKQY
ncbi:XTP/dITP diphosphatase [Gracilibacillus sp. YIM 98692]|uniref:XTP/dITP diphosphatase n=1 Tax=Gracilibacillus sp. YIM 98692 TaxID=2663532 RepID=UPI0013D16BDC|nr:XTP/dITP diphosphatase [Gracilibacillus sp. YIM 98692]